MGNGKRWIGIQQIQHGLDQFRIHLWTALPFFPNVRQKVRESEVKKILSLQLSLQQMSPLKDFLFIPFPVTAQHFHFDLGFSPSDSGRDDKKRG